MASSSYSVYRGNLGQLAFIAAILLLSSVVSLPFSYYRQFVIEEKFGFNRMTRALFFMDLLKGIVLGSFIGAPLLLAVLWLMDKSGQLWWFYTWLTWNAFSLLMLLIYPTVIAPLFNKFKSLENESLKQRIETLLQRCGFESKGVFVMDGSRRSSHGNAYFTGFGRNKRIVFFDTLLERLQPEEIEAVLAHELGHFKHHHVTKRLIMTVISSLGILALLGYLTKHAWFYTQLGVMPLLNASDNALALVLFMLLTSVFGFFLTPLSNLLSRRHEFEADAFAGTQTHAMDLVTALVKLSKDNASTLTPDPVYATFYYSHPPVPHRVEALLKNA